MHGLNEPGPLGIVPQHLAQLVNGVFDQRIAHIRARPDSVEHYPCGHQLASMLGQVAQYSEGFRPQDGRLRPAPQPLVAQLQAKGRKEKRALYVHCFFHGNSTEILPQFYDFSARLGLYLIA